MVKDAEANAATDKEKSEQIDLKNQSDALCYQTRKQIEELGDKISSDEKVKIEDLITKLEDATKQENYAVMKELNERIKTNIMELGQKVYSQNPDDASATPNDDVIETDFSTEK
jgi:molecular chaperone DnaK (HSP70)